MYLLESFINLNSYEIVYEAMAQRQRIRLQIEGLGVQIPLASSFCQFNFKFIIYNVCNTAYEVQGGILI